jgi:probable rRNA maturation factor
MDISARCEGLRYPTEALEADAERLLLALELPEAELSLVLCTDPFIRRLNKQYRGKDQPTDVLSFAMQEGQKMGEATVLGDLILSVDTARRQATEHGHRVEEELRILLVHGLLHLLGYDHIRPADAVRMRAEEARLLALLDAPSIGLIQRAGERQ